VTLNVNDEGCKEQTKRTGLNPNYYVGITPVVLCTVVIIILGIT